jgi:Hypothetical glycosyl hydrolase family 15
MVVLAVTAVGCAGAGTGGPQRARPQVSAVAPGAAAIRWWTSTEGGSEAQQAYTPNQATSIARRFEQILGLKTTFRADGLTPLMQAANPDLELIAYLNGTHMSFADATGRPESWFAHDAAGRRVRNTSFDNWVMNIRNPIWALYTAGRCLDFAQRMGTSSCYLDDMGAGNLAANFSATPVDPLTGKPYSEFSWITATAQLAAAVRSLVPGVKLYANGLNTGTKYFGGPRAVRLLDALDGAEAEAFVRGSGDGVRAYRSESDWKADVDMLVDAESHGKPVLAKTKLWVPATADERGAWRDYAFGTFLLGTNGRSSFAFNGRGPGRPEARSALETTDLGAPTAHYVKAGGAYQRSWSKGMVYVNPSTAPVTVDLGGRFRIDGQTLDNYVLRAHRAVIVKSSAAVG